MKKNLIIISMMAVIMPVYFFSNLGYKAQSSQVEFSPVEEADITITDSSALNPSNVEVYTAINAGRDISQN